MSAKGRDRKEQERPCGGNHGQRKRRRRPRNERSDDHDGPPAPCPEHKDVFPETTERREAVAFADALGEPGATQADLREYLTMLFYSPQKRDAYLARYSPGGFPMTTLTRKRFYDRPGHPCTRK
jgi:hypothetical protein